MRHHKVFLYLLTVLLLCTCCRDGKDASFNGDANNARSPTTVNTNIAPTMTGSAALEKKRDQPFEALEVSLTGGDSDVPGATRKLRYQLRFFKLPEEHKLYELRL